MNITEICNIYQTNLNTGLTSLKAKELLNKNGKNKLTPSYHKPVWYIFFENLFGWFNSLLWAGAILCFVTAYFGKQMKIDSGMNDNFLGIILILVVVLSGCFSFAQQRKSDKIMDSFEKMIPKYAQVIRDGSKFLIDVENLVIGDLVEIKGGDQIPADIRLTAIQGLKVDNSSITGESVAQSRSLDAHHLDPLEAKNLIFFSTNCLEGNGRGIIIRTGDCTVMGRIASLTSELTHEITPLANDMHKFILQITTVAILFASLVFLICLAVGFTILEAIIYFITMIVANVPEGLLPTMTVSLSLTAKRMAAKNCLVKNLLAVETLGSTSVICTDKTGTLTQNKMSTSHIWFNNQIFLAEELIDKNDILNRFSFWQDLIRNAAICSKAEFEQGYENEKIIKKPAIGDASEVAILRFIEMSIGSVDDYRSKFSKLFELPFNSSNKFSLTIVKCLQTGKIFSLMKGASECIIQKCNTIIYNNQILDLNDKIRLQFQQIYCSLGGCGERVIGFCDQELTDFTLKDSIDYENQLIPKNNYRFLGLISLVDPPRPAVPNAVKECRLAGIKIIMVTGDHPITAKAVAKSVGIITCETRDEVALKLNKSINQIDYKQANSVVVTGSELKQMDQKQLTNVLNFQEVIFARTSPQQKLTIVECCQKMNEVVAVTGDGVNDSPALKRANIGIAMGLVGSDVSKQAADLILLDDNFASIAIGIEEGRIIFDNLKKSVCYTLSSKLPQMFPFLAFIVFDIPLAMSAITILCIDIGTDIVPAISLAYELAESDIMRRKPRNVNQESLINCKLITVSYLQIGVIQTIAAYFSYILMLSFNGFLPSKIIGIRSSWYNKSIRDLKDSYGQEWTFEQRKMLEQSLYTTFLVTIILTKIFTLISFKTRKLSVFRHGFRNSVLNLAIIVQIMLTFLIVYTPGINTALHLNPQPYWFGIFAMPFALLILVYDEFRKYFIRKSTNNFFYKFTYY